MVVVHVHRCAWLVRRVLSGSILSPRRRFLAALSALPTFLLGLFEKSFAISFFLSASAVFHLILSVQCSGWYSKYHLVFAEFANPLISCFGGIPSRLLTTTPRSPFE